MSTISTYMGFPVSTIGTDSGLSWETNLNAALSVIDSHNHSPGQGQQINPSGLNINSDLPFGGNNATLLRAVRFSAQPSAIPNSGADVGEIYVAGNELYYNDVTGGHQVQITSGGTVNATSSGISSGTATAAFSTGVLLVKSSSTSYANVALQSVLLSNAGNLTNQLTLQAPTLSSSYPITLPALPGATSFLAIDASGNITAFAAVAGGLTASMIANQTITATQIANATITTTQIAAGTLTPANMATPTSNIGVTGLSYSNSTTSFTNIAGSGVVSTLVSRPIFFSFVPGAPLGTNIPIVMTDAGSGSTVSFQIIETTNNIIYNEWSFHLSASQSLSVMISSFNTFARAPTTSNLPFSFAFQAKVSGAAAATVTVASNT